MDREFQMGTYGKDGPGFWRWPHVLEINERIVLRQADQIIYQEFCIMVTAQGQQYLHCLSLEIIVISSIKRDNF